VARDLVITAATRQALLDTQRRSRRHAVLGALLAVLGAGIALGAWTLPIGFPALLLCGGIGLTIIPCGIAVVARAMYAMAATWRSLRELDERTGLPVALVRSG